MNKSLFTIWILCLIFIHIQKAENSNIGNVPVSRNHQYPSLTGSNAIQSELGRKSAEYDIKFESANEKHEKLGKRFDKLERDFNGFKSNNLFQIDRKFKSLTEQVSSLGSSSDAELRKCNGRIDSLEADVQLLKSLIHKIKPEGEDSTGSCCEKNAMEIRQMKQIQAEANLQIDQTIKTLSEQKKNAAQNALKIEKQNIEIQNVGKVLDKQVVDNSHNRQQQTLRYNGLFQSLANVSKDVQDNSKKIRDLERSSGNGHDITNKVQALEKIILESFGMINKNGENVKKINGKIQELWTKDQEKSEKLEDHSKKIDVLKNAVTISSGEVQENEKKIGENFEKIASVVGKVQENSKKVEELYNKFEENAESLNLVKGIPKKFQELNTKVHENSIIIKENSVHHLENSQNIQETIQKTEENAKKMKEMSMKIESNKANIQANSAEITAIILIQKSSTEKLNGHSQKIDQSSRKIEEILKSNVENSREIVESNKQVKMNAESILISNKAIQNNLDKIEDNSENIRKNADKIKENSVKIEQNFKNLEKISADVENGEKKVDKNYAKIQEYESHLKTQSENLKNISEIVWNCCENKKLDKPDPKTELNRTIDYIMAKISATKLAPPTTTPAQIRPDPVWEPEVTNEVQPLAYTWTIDKISENLRDSSMDLESAWFKLPGSELQAKAKFFFKDSTSDIHVALSFKDPGKPLSTYFPFPQVTYVLKDRSGSAKDRATSASVLFNSDELAFDDNVLEEFLLFKPRLLSSHFIKDDAIVLEIYLETPSMTRLSQTENATLVSQVDHFLERRSLAIKHLVGWTSSPYFYTEPKGYRVQLQLWLSLGKQIAPFVHFLTTDHDLALPASFPHRTTLTIFNPNDFSNNLVRYKETDISDETHYSLPHFTYDEVKDLVVNDNLYYQVKIEPL